MKKAGILILLAILLFLCGCGKKSATERQIVNWTLPDVATFEKDYSADQAAQDTAPSQQQTLQTAYRWNPHGVFTYVTAGGVGYSTALFKVISVDYENHCAVVTYTVKDNSGYQQAMLSDAGAKEENYFFESNGERVVGLEEKTEEDGTRHIILYLSNDHYLEFTGKDRLETAKYCYKKSSYRLKFEG